MTVLFPIGSLYPAQSGGPSNTIYWMGKALTKNNINVKIVTTNKDIKTGKVELDKWLSLDYGEVRYCKTKMHYLPMSLLLQSWRALRLIDVVHLTALYYPPSFLIALYAILLNKPIVWSIRGELHSSALQYSNIKKRIFLAFLQLLPKKRISFHATSDEEEYLIKQQFGEKVKVIQLPNYIELPKVIKPILNGLYFLFIGRIHPIKGLENLIEGLTLSKLFTHSEYKFQLAGEGDPDYLNSFKSRISTLGLLEKIFFVGSKAGLEKQALYANARFTFLLSHSENFGNVVVESLAQSTPAVTSTGTPWQLLDEKNAGYWIENSPKSIAAMIDRIILQNQNEYAQMRIDAGKLAADQFDIFCNSHKWIEVYASAIS